MSNRAPRRRSHLLAIIAALGVATGCSQQAPDQADVAASPESMMTESPPAESAPAEIPLTVVDRNEYDEVIAGLNGKVVLVDFWATWCGPCVKQFPHTIELAKQFADRGLAVVAVSFDDPNELAPVRGFLEQRGAGELTNLVNRYGLGQQAMEAFEIESGALPSYKLYDRRGRLRETFETDPVAERQFSPQDIESAIEVLLAE